MEKKLRLSILVLLGSFQPSENFLTLPLSLGWGADKRVAVYQRKRLMVNSAAISGWICTGLKCCSGYHKKAKYQNIDSYPIVCAARNFPSPRLLEREAFNSSGGVFWETQHTACKSPQMLWGSFSFGVSCNLQDWCWERKSHATAHKRKPWGAGEVKEGQMGWHSFLVSGGLPTVVWSNCSLHQFCSQLSGRLHLMWDATN